MTPEKIAEIEARAGSVKTWKPVHSAEPIPQICDVDVPALVAEVKRLTAERDSLKGLLSGSQTELRDAVAAWGKAERERDEARAALDRVRELAEELIAAAIAIGIDPADIGDWYDHGAAIRAVAARRFLAALDGSGT